jgi:hypothetical protein
MSSFAERLSWIITTLCGALGAYGRRIASPPQPVWLGTRCYTPAIAPERLPRLPVALWNLFIQRVERTAARIQMLHAQWRAGTLPPPRPGPAPRPDSPPKPPRPRLPRGFGWAIRHASELAAPAGMLHMLLQEPDARRFLSEVPRAARRVRPLCTALNIAQPEWLRLPPRPRPPRKPQPRRDRPPALTDKSLGLQPYHIAAARASRKRYG